VNKRRVRALRESAAGEGPIAYWIASPKGEYAARTFMPKLRRALPEFLEEFPKLKRHPFQGSEGTQDLDWRRMARSLEVNTSGTGIDWFEPGQKAARKMLRHFVDRKLGRYDERRSDPNLGGQSGLSPYLHFGQISAQRIALDVQKSTAYTIGPGPRGPCSGKSDT